MPVRRLPPCQAEGPLRSVRCLMKASTFLNQILILANSGYTQTDCYSQHCRGLALASCRRFRLNVRVTVLILSDLVHQIRVI